MRIVLVSILNSAFSSIMIFSIGNANISSNDKR